MKYRVLHHTLYDNAQPVSVGHNEAWLTPRTTERQKVVSHRLDIHPQPSTRSTLTDYFGNTVTQFLFNQGYSSLSIAAINEVELLPPNRSAVSVVPWETVLQQTKAHDTPDTLAAYEFKFESPRCRCSDEFADYARVSFAPRRPMLEALSHLMKRFDEDFRYDSAATTVSTPVEQVFRQHRGVCQDFAHLMISMLRSLGFAARYVSGYLRTLPPPGKPRLVGADASHAWLSVYAGESGWVDLDPTNCQFPSMDHVTLAWGRDYSDVAPVKGVYIGGTAPQMRVSVDVCPLVPEA
jgi:transglutaminase-like putative cysteine protease